MDQHLLDAVSLLKEYEQWEADIISEDELWQPYRAKDVLRGHIYDKMMDLQEKRNAFMARFSSSEKQAKQKRQTKDDTPVKYCSDGTTQCSCWGLVCNL